MDTSVISQFVSRAMYLTLIISGPLLLICLAIGIIISIFQALTQIHEQSLTFVPKILAVIVAIVIMGSWMMGQLESFMREVFNKFTSI